MGSQSLILLTFGIYAVTLVLYSYSGPFNIFSLLRNKSPELIREIMSCYVCLSWYVALLFAVATGMNWVEYLGVVGGAIVLWMVTER